MRVLSAGIILGLVSYNMETGIESSSAAKGITTSDELQVHV